MKKYAIFGNPVIHSKSPHIFNSLFEEWGQSNIYKRVRINEAQEIIAVFDQYDLSGANITSPFKETILPFLDKVDNVSKEINSVNTVIKKGDHFYGFNTDVYGVENAIINNGLNVKNKKCIVLGAGGAAKAAIYALNNLGALTQSVNRTDSKSLKISRYFNCKHILFEKLEENLKDTYLIIIAIKNMDIDLSKKIKDTIVLNANYNSDKYEDRSSRIIDGHDWLISQASKAFEIFFDKIPNQLSMKRSLNNIERKPSNIALIGMSGVGKTFYGKIISEKLNKTYLDVDELVEKKAEISIMDIFRDFGEERFRDYEKEVLGELSSLENTVIALGAGAILSQDIRKILSENYFVVHLHVDIQELVNMFLNKESSIENRPLLRKKYLRQDIENLFKNRKEYYFTLSDLTIYLNSDKYDENISKIESELQRS